MLASSVCLYMISVSGRALASPALERERPDPEPGQPSPSETSDPRDIRVSAHPDVALSSGAIQISSFIDVLGPVTWSLLKKAGADSIIDRQNWSTGIALRAEADGERGGHVLGGFVRRYPDHTRSDRTEFADPLLGETFKSSTAAGGYGAELGWRFGPRGTMVPWSSALLLTVERSWVDAVLFGTGESVDELQRTEIRSELTLVYLRVLVAWRILGSMSGLELAPSATIPLVVRTREFSRSDIEAALEKELDHREQAAIGASLNLTLAF